MFANSQQAQLAMAVDGSAQMAPVEVSLLGTAKPAHTKSGSRFTDPAKTLISYTYSLEAGIDRALSQGQFLGYERQHVRN